jgi:cytochrome b involved in lipid metabolism
MFAGFDSTTVLLVVVAVIGVLIAVAVTRGNGGARPSASVRPAAATAAGAGSSAPARVFASRDEEVDSKGVTYYSKEAVAKHNKPDDIWIIVDGKVFDVTPYVDKHMGGEEAITRYAGQDNTAPFHGDQHPLKVREVLDEFYIGRVSN